MKGIKYALLFISISSTLFSQTFLKHNPLAHTYSIVARDAETGEMGVAVQSHWFSVGTIVTWGEAGIGVIATQSFVNPAFGPDGLKLLKTGMSAGETLDKLIKEDEGRDYRQLAILDKNGNVAAYTGKSCIADAGQIVGKDFSAQANLMLNDNIWKAMSESFKNSKGPLAERLVSALEAGEAAGGDIRGKQSAALLVVSSESTGKPWIDRTVDIRVDDSHEPLKELRRILEVHRAYEHMNAGDLAMEEGDMEKALVEYSKAESMFPDNLEMKFWHAVTLANNGKLPEALPMFRNIFIKDANWKVLIKRLPEAGLLTVNEKSLLKILE